MTYKVAAALIVCAFLALYAPGQSCPIITRGSFCAAANGSEPPFYKFCSSPTGLWFDQMALTFNIQTAEADDNGPSCGYDCVANQNCVQSTITVSGIDCNGTRQIINHKDCCEMTVD